MIWSSNIREAEKSSEKSQQKLVRKNSSPFLAGIYMFKVNNRNTIKKCEICSKLTLKIPEKRQ